ncbi:rhodanese-like domain-containing protein [Flagellimonas sp. DF-77]|uniref:rhodanese-like domain-containing protein n=1 Tax=Flagellimonas algarum TaxID=3230298 RepID=UPI003398E77D
MLRKTMWLFLWGAMVMSCQGQKDSSIQIVDKTHIKSEVIGKEVQLIDVRTPKEFDAGHIEGAVNFNIADAATFLEQLATLDKNKPVYLYCKLGGRSGKAAQILKKEGFTNIFDYSGGYQDWSH